MTHRIKLSNGEILIVEEGKDCLVIATGYDLPNSDPDSYICEINGSGVLVMPNSGDATHTLCNKLSI